MKGRVLNSSDSVTLYADWQVKKRSGARQRLADELSISRWNHTTISRCINKLMIVGVNTRSVVGVAGRTTRY